MSFPLYRCAACGSPHVVETTQTDGIKYDFVKGAIGTVVLGTGGAVAGVTNRTKKAFQCPDCGLTLDHPMPMELKCSIDLGVSSSRMRNGILVGGMQFTWEEITKQFRNIESGDGDEEIAQQKLSEEELLLSKATATQEEFDRAFDTLHQYATQNYSTMNLPTKKAYSAAVEALYTVVENCYKYLPPSRIKADYDGTTPYRKWKDFHLVRCIDDYTLFRYYEHTGTFLDNVFRDREEDRIKYLEPFIPTLVSKYHINDMNALWKVYDGDASFFIFTPELDNEHIFWQIRSLIGGMEESGIEESLWTIVALPRMWCDESTFAYTDWAFTNSPLNGETYEGKPQTNLFFQSYPEKKAEYDALLNDYKAEKQKEDDAMAEAEKAVQKIQKQIKAKEEKQNALATQKAEHNQQISTLSKKIFGKAKTQAEIEHLKELVSEIEQQESALVAESEAFPQLLETAENNLSALQNNRFPCSSKYKRRICAKMNYFIVWHPIEEAEEPGEPTDPSEPLTEEIKIAEPDDQNGSSPNPSAYADQLRELKALLDEGILTQEEFDAKKRQILGL